MPALAAWSSNPSVNTPITTSGGDQVAPRSVDDGSGGTIIVWADRRSGSQDIYALHIDARGNVVPGWSPTGTVICNLPGDQDNPVIVPDGAGGALIAWSDARAGESDIYALRIRGNGSLASGWTAGGSPVCTAPGDQGPVSALQDDNGGILMVWRDERNGNFDLYAQRMRNNGSIPKGWSIGGVAVCTDPADQDAAAIASDGDGGLFIAWQDERNPDVDIYASRIRSNGRIRGDWQPSGKPMCAAEGDQFAPTVAPDDQRGMYIVWEDFRGGLTSDLYGVRAQQNGNLRRGWTTDGNVICNAPGDQFTPQAKMDEWGNVNVVWEDYRNGIDNPDIYAIKIRGDGRRFWFWPDNGLAVCTAAGFQFEPQLTTDGNNGAIITWEDYRAGLGDASIYAKRLGWLGVWPNYWATDGIPVSNAAGNQQFPAISGAGNVVIAWEDSRNGSRDIYAQRLEVQGTLGNNSPAAAAAPGPGDPPPGFVQLAWAAPPLDDPGATPLRIGSYRVWRDVAAVRRPPGAVPASRSPAAVTSPDNALVVADDTGVPVELGDGVEPRALPDGAPGESGGRLWRVVTTLAANGAPLYSVNVPLPGDAGNPGYGLFRIEALEAEDRSISWMSDWLEVWSTTTADASVLRPDGLHLARPRPNPARGPVQIPFSLAGETTVRVGIYAADGRRVRDLDRGLLAAGQHILRWDRRDAAGRDVPAGVYFIRLEADGAVRTRRLAILD